MDEIYNHALKKGAYMITEEKHSYENPLIELLLTSEEDIITTSGETGGDTGGDDDGKDWTGEWDPL